MYNYRERRAMERSRKLFTLSFVYVISWYNFLFIQPGFQRNALRARVRRQPWILFEATYGVILELNTTSHWISVSPQCSAEIKNYQSEIKPWISSVFWYEEKLKKIKSTTALCHPCRPGNRGGENKILQSTLATLIHLAVFSRGGVSKNI